LLVLVSGGVPINEMRQPEHYIKLGFHY